MGFNHAKWQEVEAAKIAVTTSLKLVSMTEQPLLAKARNLALDEIQKCAEAFAAFERENNISEERETALHNSFYKWLDTCVQLVRC